MKLKKTLIALRNGPHAPSRKGAIAAAVLETLEQRRLLSTSIISNGVVIVDGDTNSTVLLIQTSSGTLTVTEDGINVIGTFTQSQVTGILVDADDGSDTVTIDPSVSSGINTTINGDGGDDTITGGLGSDSMAGGAGWDTYKFSGASNLGSDTINEAADTDTDTIDFTGFSQTASLDVSLTTPKLCTAASSRSR